MFKKYFSLFLLLFLPFLGYAQFNLNMDTIRVCYEGEVIQVSTFPQELDYVDISTNNFDTVTSISDDIHTGLIDLNFDFEFFGVSYDQVNISTNGYVSFNPANANTFSQWNINADIPNAVNTDAQNSIMCPYTDSEPGPASNMIYGTAGVAPNRIFIVFWNDFEMFGGACNAFCYSSGVILVEGSHQIYNSIGNYKNCDGWNSGASVQGLYKDATTAIIVNDPVTGLPRNFSDPWGAEFETVWYKPSNGGASYTYEFLSGFTNFFQPLWYDSLGNYIGQDFALDYVGPDLTSLPSFISVETVQCGDTLRTDVPVIVNCPEIVVDEMKPETCDGTNDGSLLVSVTSPCPQNETWTVELSSSTGQVLQTQTTNSFPITFSNLGNDLYTLKYSSTTIPCRESIEQHVAIEFFEPQYHADVNDVLCYGESTGEILFYPHGGFNTGWIVNVRDVSGAIVKTVSSNTTPLILDGLKAGTYNVEVNSPTTCPVTIPYTINQPDPLYFFKAERDNNNCGAFTGFYDYIPANGTPPYTYYVNGKQTINLSETQVANGVYELKVIDDRGCEIVDNIEVLDMYSPIVDFDMPLEVNLADGAVSFTDLTEPNPHTTLTNWHWEFGDSEVSFEQNPKHTYSDIGEYKVHLFVTDATGCQEFAVKTIRVVKPEFLLPTVFTPNGDGNNEVFIPVLDKIVPDDFKITISDRWGRIVYTSTNIFEGWDGRDTKGNIAEGSYIWIAEFKDKFGHDHVSDGFVQLIR